MLVSDRVMIAAPPQDEVVVLDGETYYRFPNGGGLVALTASVSPYAHVAAGALVRGFAVLTTSARLFDNTVVEDHAFVGSMVTLRGKARAGGRAVITDGVILRDESYVGGSTYLRGPIVVEGKCRIVDQTLHGRFVIH